MSLDTDNKADRFLLLLLVVDIVFIVLHVIYGHTALLPTRLFSLEQDRGYAEVFQYIKEFWIALMLCFVAIRKSHLLYFGWSLLFFYLLLDDAISIHERVGWYLSDFYNLNAMYGLRAGDIGELVVSISIGVPLLLLIGIAHYRSNPADRRISTILIVMLAFLAFFGVAVDMIHVIVMNTKLGGVVGIVEDGGELVVMSVITWFVFSLNVERK